MSPSPNGGDTTAEEPAFHCPVCRAPYSRIEHLQRHLASHSTARPFTCVSCGRSYRRKDVLTRHRLHCQQEEVGEDERPRYQRSTRTSSRRACNRCARQKRACSCTEPCDNCAAKGQICTYPAHVVARRQQEAAKSVVNDAQTAMLEGTDTASLPARFDLFQNLENLEEWLPALEDGTEKLDFAWSQPGQDAQALHFHSFILGSPVNGGDQVIQDQVVQASNSSASSYSQPNVSLGDGINGTNGNELSIENREPARRFHWLIQFTKHKGLLETFEFGQPSWDPGLPSTRLSTDPLPPPDHEAGSPSAAEEVDDGRLAMKSMEILSSIKRLIQTRPHNIAFSLEWSSMTEAIVQQFFSPSNISRFTELYWERWHPHWPMIHRPSFRYHSTSPILLAALVLVGASLSSLPSDNENAHVWFDIIEELVFSDPQVAGATLSSAGYTSRPNEQERYTKIQAIQAAHTVCCYQCWEGSEMARDRVRRVRFNALVAMVRELGLTNARHKNMLSLDEKSFDWREFIRIEEMVRTLICTFTLDAAFVMFNNFPPRFVLRELNASMAYPEACFNATTAAQCLAEIRAWQLKDTPSLDGSLYAAVKTFCSTNFEPKDAACFANAGLLNLFAIVQAFHLIIFHLDPAIGSGAQSLPVLEGIRNWRRVWTQRVKMANDDVFDLPIAENVAASYRYRAPKNGRRMGFFRHCAEYWLLARIVVARRIARQGESLELPDEFPNAAVTWLSSLEPSPFDGYDQSGLPRMASFLRAQEQLL